MLAHNLKESLDFIFINSKKQFFRYYNTIEIDLYRNNNKQFMLFYVLKNAYVQ